MSAELDPIPWLDEDGYPTDHALLRIEHWPHETGLLQFVRTLWYYPDAVSTELSDCEVTVAHVPHEPVYRFATGGWSGNESLIASLKRNHLWWITHWRLSAIGGLFIFLGDDPLSTF